MRRLAMILLSAALPALAGCPNGGTFDAGSLGPDEEFAVAVEQDGLILEPEDDTVHLARKPFVLLLVFRKPKDSALVNVSFRPDMYETARAGRSVGVLSPLPQQGIKEPLMNPYRRIVVSDSAYHYWYHYGPTIHRFDDNGVRKIGGVWVCRRTVEAYRVQDRAAVTDIAKIDPPALYLTFVRTSWSGNRQRVQKDTRTLRLVFE